MTPTTAAQLAELCQKTFGQATLEGDGAIIISGVNQLESASPGELSFVANRKAAERAGESKAGCLLVPLAFENAVGRTLVRVADPRAAFARLIGLWYPPKRQTAGVHPTACVDATAILGEGVSVGPHVSIGPRTVLGNGCQIGSGCAIGGDVVDR